MIQNGVNIYQNNAVLTASPQELTLMLYNGAIKFGNQAIVELENNNMEKVNHYLKRVQDIIDEFRMSLKQEIAISKDMDKIYEYMNYRLREANFSKDKTMIEEVLGLLRELRDTWKEAMTLAKTGR
jgi:flagellar protein FliS